MKQSEFLHALREECGSEPVPPVIHRAVVNACAALPERQGRRPIHWFAWAPKLAVGLLCVAAFAGFSAMLLLNLSLPAEDPHNSRLSSSQTSELPEVKPSASPLPVPTEAELRPLIEERLKKALTIYYQYPLQVDMLLEHMNDPLEVEHDPWGNFTLDWSELESVFDWDAINDEYQDKYHYGIYLLFTAPTALSQTMRGLGALETAVEELSKEQETRLLVDAGIAGFGIDSIHDVTGESCTVECRLKDLSAEISFTEHGSIQGRFPYREMQCSVEMKLEDGLWRVDEITETARADVIDRFQHTSSLQEALEYIQTAIEKDLEIVLGWKEAPLPEGPYAEQNGFIVFGLTSFYPTEESDEEFKFYYQEPWNSGEHYSYDLFREDGRPEWYMGSWDPLCLSHNSVVLCPDENQKRIMRFFKNKDDHYPNIDPGEIVAEFTIDLETLTISPSETWKDKNSLLLYDREAFLSQRWYFPSYSATEYDPEPPVQVLYATSSPYYASYSGDCLVALAFAPGAFREMNVRADREDGSSGFSETIGTGRSVKLDHFTLEEYDLRLGDDQSDFSGVTHDCATGPYLLADDFPEGTEFCVVQLSFGGLKVGYPLKDGETISLSFRDPEDYHQILYETSFTIALPEIGLQENEQLAHLCLKGRQPYIVVPKE